MAEEDPEEDAAELLEAVLPLHADFGQKGFQPYVLDLQKAGLAVEEPFFTIAFVVMTRKEGMLLALPELAIPAEAQGLGAKAGPTDLLGPSVKVKVQAALMQEDALLNLPTVLEGKTLTVLLMDFSLEVEGCLRGVAMKEDLEDVTSFEFLEENVVPAPGELVTKAQLWARGSDESA